MEDFITGRSTITSTGAFAAPRPRPAGAGGVPRGDAGDGDAKDVVLAARTSQLMASYRDYVDGGGDPEVPGGRIRGAGGGDGGDRAAGAGPLLRGWGPAPSRYSPEAAAGAGSDDGSYSSEDGGAARGGGHRYARAVYRSGKFRRLLLGIVAAGAAIAAVAAVGRSGRRGRGPDWDQELAEELREEKAAVARGLPLEGLDAAATEEQSPAAAAPADEAAAPLPLREEDVREEGATALAGAELEAVTRHVLCCAASHAAPAAPVGDLVSAEYELAEAHRPRWYARADGWGGRTRGEALAFCATRPGGAGLCPYEAYCPTGPGGLPLGGIRAEENEEGGRSPARGSRAPVGDRPDGWVQVGSWNVCAQYDIVDAGDGTQVKKEVGSGMAAARDNEGGDGDRAAAASATEPAAQTKADVEEQGHAPVVKPDTAAIVKEYIAESNQASANDLVEEIYVPVAKPRPIAVAEGAVSESEENHAAGNPEAPYQPHERESANPEQEEVPQPSAAIAAPAVAPQFDMETLLHRQFRPLWLSSRDGWNGGSHADAVQFCATIRGKRLCPYSAMCPRGPGHMVMGGRHAREFAVEGEQYAPVLGGHWVRIGGEGDAPEKCRTHREQEGTEPAWGRTEIRAEMKEHVMCCTMD